VEDGELRVISRMSHPLRAPIAQHIPASVPLVDELMADRRAEFAREEAEHQARQQGPSST